MAKLKIEDKYLPTGYREITNSEAALVLGGQASDPNSDSDPKLSYYYNVVPNKIRLTKEGIEALRNGKLYWAEYKSGNDPTPAYYEWVDENENKEFLSPSLELKPRWTF